MIIKVKFAFATDFEVALVSDINPGSPGAIDDPFGFAPRREFAADFKGALYFQANDGQHGAELWRTTAGGGVEIVADIAPGSSGSEPHSFEVYQHRLYFAATTAETDAQLFRFDGTAVSVATTIDPGPGGAEIGDLTIYDDALYFTHCLAGEAHKVWRFDGTSAAPVAAINNTPPFLSGPNHLHAIMPFDGQLYYIVESAPLAYTLWSYDGTEAEKIMDLSGPTGGFSTSFDLGVYNGALYFGVLTGSSDPSYWTDELWSYDGKSPPKKIGALDEPGGAVTGSSPTGFQVYKNRLYFGTKRAYRYNGTVLEDLSAPPTGFPSWPRRFSRYLTRGKDGKDGVDLLFFSGNVNGVDSWEPYVFDGTMLTLLKNIKPDIPGDPFPGSFPTFATQSGGKLYFFADDDEHGRELWVYHAKPAVEVNAILVPIWENKLKWPVREGVRDLLVATYLVAEGRPARLVGRTAVRLPAKPERLIFPVFEIDRSRDDVPEAFGLLSVVFDKRSGETLDVGVEMFGLATAAARAAIRRTSEAHAKEVRLEHVLSERIEDDQRARRPRAQVLASEPGHEGALRGARQAELVAATDPAT